MYIENHCIMHRSVRNVIVTLLNQNNTSIQQLSVSMYVNTLSTMTYNLRVFYRISFTVDYVKSNQLILLKS